MRVLIAFDVDGTLDTSSGPVPFTLLRKLDGDGVRVAIVSPSDRWPKTEYPLWNFAVSDRGRAENLIRAKLTYSSPEVCLYVSDNKDYDAAHAAGFFYVEAQEFVKGVVL